MKISVIHPSYGRPELAARTAEKWLTSCNDIEYILCLSKKDTLIEHYAVRFGSSELLTIFVRKVLCEDANMVIQMNMAARKSTGDLIIAISDDFNCPKNWDKLLLDKLAGKKDFVVRIDDGVRNAGIDSKNIIPLPIMDRVFYERLGYIYHPAYNHFFGDQELCRVSEMLGKKIELPILFEHMHPAAGKAKKDHVNEKNSKFHSGDKATFQKREAEGFGLIKLSILIPTLENRKGSLGHLIDDLQEQIARLKAENVVQLIKFTDAGQKSIGEKRNYLVHYASGDYVAFIDDDDTVCPTYVQLLLAAIQDKPDCCSLNGVLTTNNGKQKKVFKHSIAYIGWYEKDSILYRFPNHLNTIKREIALQIPYPEISRGEDKKYSELMQESGLLKTEAIINEPLYFYNYVRK